MEAGLDFLARAKGVGLWFGAVDLAGRVSLLGGGGEVGGWGWGVGGWGLGLGVEGVGGWQGGGG